MDAGERTGEQFELDAAGLQGRRQAHELGGVAGQALQLMAGLVLILAAPLPPPASLHSCPIRCGDSMLLRDNACEPSEGFGDAASGEVVDYA
jgi:hypothetical protein